MSAFDDATTVRPTGSGTYEVSVDRGWTIGDKPNGGYLLALLCRAAVDGLATAPDTVGPGRAVPPGGAPPVHSDPLSASAVYLRTPESGPALVQVEILRAGRSASQVRSVLLQSGQPCVDAVYTLGYLDPDTAARWSAEPPVELAPEAACILLPPTTPGGIFVSTLERTEVRLDPAVLGFSTGRPGGRGELRGWLRFTDGRAPDPISLLYVVDAFPPATFELGSIGWVPTMQMTAYVRAAPAPGPLRVRQQVRLVDGALVDETCDVWDSRDRLVAQGVQLARVRFPAEPG
jgi:hypothetical protein